MNIPRISRTVATRLGFYVYLYVDPVDNSVFYVGKGKNGRALVHLKADERQVIAKRIQKIRAGGMEPRIEILAHGLSNEKTALKVEAAAIDLLGMENLANAVRGHGIQFGRLPFEEVVAHYTRKEAKIREPSILIRINQVYRYGMSPVELYDATRTSWKVGERAKKAQLAFAVFEGTIREVYRITGWLQAGSSFNVHFEGKKREVRDRLEFVGTLAEEVTRKRYINKYVGLLFTPEKQHEENSPHRYGQCLGGLSVGVSQYFRIGWKEV